MLRFILRRLVHMIPLTLGITFIAFMVMQLAPGSDAWVAAAKALHPKRLNAPDGELQLERWARESTIWT